MTAKNKFYTFNDRDVESVKFNGDALRAGIVELVTKYTLSNTYLDEDALIRSARVTYLKAPAEFRDNEKFDRFNELSYHFISNLVGEMMDDMTLDVVEYSGSEVVVLSREHIDSETRDFNLDESISNQQGDERRLIISAIIEILLECQDDYPDGIDLGTLKYWVRGNVAQFKLLYTFDEIENIVNELIDEGLLVRWHSDTGPDSERDTYIKLSTDSFEKMTADFNLDEGIELDILRDEATRVIIGFLVDHDYESGYSAGSLAANVKDILDDKGHWTSTTFITRIVRSLVADGTLIRVVGTDAEGSTWSGIKISPDYVERETQDFNLDEGIKYLDQPAAYTVINTHSDFEFNRENIKEIILNVVTDGMSRGAYLEKYVVVAYVTEAVELYAIKTKFSLHYANFLTKLRNAIYDLIDELIRGGTLVMTDVDPYTGARAITLSDSYLSNVTQDFNLDESVKKAYDIIGDNVTFDDEQIKAAIIARIALSGEKEVDALDVSHYAAQDIFDNDEEHVLLLWQEVRQKINKVIDDLVDEGIVIRKVRYEPVDNNFAVEVMPIPVAADEMIMTLSLAPDYLSKQTQDFSLDEAVNANIISSSIQKMIVDFIIEKLSSLPEDETGHSVDFLVFMISRKFFGDEAHREERIVRKIVKSLVDDGKIIVINHDIWEEVRISPEYIAKETADFNLDEARYFDVENDKYSFDEQAIIDLIIELAHKHTLRGSNISRVGFTNLISYEISSNETFPSTKSKDFVNSFIEKLIKHNVLEEKPNEDGFVVITLSDECLTRETSDFNLEESNKTYHDNAKHTDEMLVKEIFDSIAFHEEVPIWLLLLRIRDIAQIDEYEDIVDPTQIILRAEQLIKNMIADGTLDLHVDIADDQCVSFSDEYLRRETSDFNLDEGRLQQKKYYSKEYGKRPKFDAAAIRALIVDRLAEGNAESHRIRNFRGTILDTLADNRWMSLTTNMQDLFEKYVTELIKSMIDEGTIELIEDDSFWGDMIKLSDEYLEKDVSDFNLD